MVSRYAGRFATKKSFHGREIFILNYTESERSKFYLLVFCESNSRKILSDSSALDPVEECLIILDYN